MSVVGTSRPRRAAPDAERIPAVERMAATASLSVVGRGGTFVGGTTGRIGVAVAVPAPLDALLVSCRASTGDPLACLIPPHVTLVPPQEMADHALPQVAEHLSVVASRAEPFVIRLRGTGTFRPVSPVVYLTLCQGAEQVTVLETAVRAGVLGSERVFPFHPHVTLAHGVDEEHLDRVAAEMAGFDASFEVSSLRLYRYGSDALWHALSDHPLGGA